ncbi:MAG: TIGR04086 family membrane protein, partial [Clostridia bacterium]
KYIDIFVYVSLAISVFISSIILNKRLMKKGIIIGSIFGLSITLIIYLFSFLAIDTTMLNINMLYNIIISVLSGMLRWGVRC